MLILGSMPGKASLLAQQYYAHPRNAFWTIMGALFDAGPGLTYAARTTALQSAGIALWDVLASCARSGSLDADIDMASTVSNDFNTFFRDHRAIRDVFFNGAKAEECFRRHVSPTLKEHRFRYHRLPSTSPAHASLTIAEKTEVWRAALHAAHIGRPTTTSHTTNAHRRPLWIIQ